MSQYKTQIRIKRPADVRKVAQRCINELLTDGEGMTNSKGKTISTLLNTSLRAMELSDVQEKLERIEEILEDRGDAKW